MAQDLQISLLALLKGLLLEVKNFLRQEAQLVKTEFGEKFSQWGGDAAWVGIGGVAAYAGLIVVLIAFGLLAALGFQQLEIDSPLAMSAGFGAIGLLAAITGAIILLKASKAFSKENLAPERAIANLQKLRGEPVPIRLKDSGKEKEKEKENRVRSEDIEKKVIATEDRLGRTFEEIERRLTFARARRRISERVRLHPYRCGMLALAAGLAAGFIFTRKLRF